MSAPHVLYTFPFSCALAVELVLRLHGQPYTVHRVTRGPGRKVATEALAAINPKRKVPTLVDAHGHVHTEIVAILHHLDEAGVARTGPERRAHLEWLCFVASELHQQVLGPAFDPATPEATVEDIGARLLPPVLAHVEAVLAEHDHLIGDDRPSGADAYLLWALLLVRTRWPEAAARPGIQRFLGWMLSHDAVREGVRREQEALAA